MVTTHYIDLSVTMYKVKADGSQEAHGYLKFRGGKRHKWEAKFLRQWIVVFPSTTFNKKIVVQLTEAIQSVLGYVNIPLEKVITVDE